MKKHLLSSKSKTASALQFHILFFLLRGFLLRLMVALLLQKLHLLRDGVLRFGLLFDLGLLRREDFADPIANILHGYEPNALFREKDFCVVANLQIISTKTTEILYHKGPHSSSSDFFQQCGKAGSIVSPDFGRKK